MSTDERRLTLSAAQATSMCVLIAAFAAVQGLRFGFQARDYLELLGVALVSIALIFGGLLALAPTEEQRRSWLGAAAIFALLVPFGLACYVAFYRGLWGLMDLRDGWSWLPLLRAPLCFGVGLRLTKALGSMTQ